MNRMLLFLSLAALAGPAALATGAPLSTTAAAPDVSGPHFTLNLIGVEDVKRADMTTGHRIFVPLHGECRIDLHEEDQFQVEDGNCTDGRSAFALPDPDPDNDGIASYRVFVKALGKPGGSADLRTCIEDSSGDTYCSTENVFIVRAGGLSPSMDVSRTLLTVCHDRDGDGLYEREQIFDDENNGYFWKYTNDGLRLAQLRFYPNTPTDISGPCPGV